MLQRKQKPARRISSSIPTSPPTSIFILTVIPLIQSRHTICPRLSHLHVPYTFLPSQKPQFNIIFLSLSSMALFYGHRHMFKMLKPFLKNEANFPLPRVILWLVTSLMLSLYNHTFWNNHLFSLSSLFFLTLSIAHKPIAIWCVPISHL